VLGWLCMSIILALNCNLAGEPREGNIVMLCRPMLQYVATVFVLLVYALAVEAWAFNDHNDDEIYFKYNEIWNHGLQCESDYEIIFPEGYNIEGDIPGIEIDTEGRVYISDKISGRLICLTNRGDFKFGVGTQGEGPEDLKVPGGILLGIFGGVGQYDLSDSPKLVMYSMDGTYRNSIYFYGQAPFTRMWHAGGAVYGLSMYVDYSPNRESTGQVYFTRSDYSGENMNSISLHDVTLPAPGTEELNEKDIDVWPRIAISTEGIVYMQHDPYNYIIKCYDPEMKLQWEYVGKDSAVKRTAAELQLLREQTPWINPGEYNHVLSDMLARDNGELWIEVAACRKDSVRCYDRIDGKGNYLGSSILQNSMPHCYYMTISGEYAVWINVHGERGENATTPYVSYGRIDQIVPNVGGE